jgi:hypothetical protein
MTSLLRRKRPTTVPARSTRVRRAVELLGLTAWLLIGGLAHAQYAPHFPPSAGSTPGARIQPPTVGLQQTAYQPLPPPRLADVRADEQQSLQEITIQLDPPGPDKLFLFPSEAGLRETLIQEGKNRNPPDKITFPEEPILTRERYYGRNWPQMCMVVEPNYCGYKRLLFEQKNEERYTWDLGPVQPLLCAMSFYKDVLLLPYHSFTDPFRCYEYNTGYGLPGDPVPYLLYPPELSFTGALAETSAVLAVMAIFP